MPDSKPHSVLVEKAQSRIDTTKTEDMVPSSELRRWLVNYLDLFEQYQSALTIIEAVAYGKVGPAHGVLARDLLSNPASSPGVAGRAPATPSPESYPDSNQEGSPQ